MTKKNEFKNIEIGLLIDQASTYIASINGSFVETGTRLLFCSRLYYIIFLSLFYEEGQAYFRDAVIDHFWCPWIVMYWKTVMWIVIEVHSVKPELSKFSIVLYVHWRSIEENKSLTWPNDLS